MSVREFELFHGVVLAKLLRSDRPVSLRLVETQASQDWSTYTLNDEVNLLVSHSRSPRQYRRGGGGTSWQFVFSENQMRQIGSPVNEKPVWLALVCAAKEFVPSDICVCLLDPDQIAKIIDLSSSSQNVTIRKPAGQAQLRVVENRREVFKVPRSRIENWEVPGS